MRNLLFRNTLSDDKRKRLVSSSETIDKNGTRTVIHRHFIYMAQEVAAGFKKPVTQVHVIKARNTRLQTEDFLCKVKGGLVIAKNKRHFFVHFVHSLRIHLCAIEAHKV